MNDLVSITDAAKMVGLSRPRMSKIIKEHQIPKTKVGGTFLVPRQAIDEVMTTLENQGRTRKSRSALTTSPKPLAPETIGDIKISHLEQRILTLETQLELLKNAKPQGEQSVVQPGANEASNREKPYWQVLLDCFLPWG